MKSSLVITYTIYDKSYTKIGRTIVYTTGHSVFMDRLSLERLTR